MASDRKGESRDLPKETPDSQISDVKLDLLSLSDEQNCKSLTASVESDSKYAPVASSSASAAKNTDSNLRATSPGSCGTDSVSASALQTQAGAAEIPHVALAASLTCSLPPLSESALNVPALPPPYLDVSLQDVGTMEQVRNDAARKKIYLSLSLLFVLLLLFFFQIVEQPNKESLHEVPINRAVHLTSGDSVKPALLLELDISVSLTEYRQCGFRQL